MNISKILLLCGGCGLLNCLNVNAQRPDLLFKRNILPIRHRWYTMIRYFFIRRMMKIITVH